MPRPYTYTRTRRILLQVALLAVLGGTLGLAALVGKARVGPSGVPLEQRQLKPFVFLAPRWPSFATEPVPNSNPWLAVVRRPRTLVAKEPPDKQGRSASRTLEVSFQPVMTGTSVEHYLMHEFHVPRGSPAEPADVAGQPGTLVRVPAPQASEYYNAPVYAAYACTVLDGGRAVTVRLEVPDRPPDDRDLALVKQVAESITTGTEREGAVADR